MRSRHSGWRARASLVVVMAVAFAVVTAFTGNSVASADPTANQWLQLRVCESGNNYAINTGNGYYGAYQFDLSTWRSVGGTGYPNQASPATQDALALKLWQQRGWSPWACRTAVDMNDPGPPAAAAPPPSPPNGFIDSVSVTAQTATVAGWAYDPNQSSASIRIDVYVNGAYVGAVANGSRGDVNSAFGIGGQHGFSIAVPLRGGQNGLCLFAIGIDSNNTSMLGCRSVTAAIPPSGYLDSMSVSGWTVTINGWAYDPNQPNTSTRVYFYVNDKFYATPANGPRSDVNNWLGIGGNHGFQQSAPLTAGSNTVCVYAIGVDVNAHTLLGCRTVQSAPAPRGWLDSVLVNGSNVTVNGWAYDPNQPNTSTRVYFYVNDTFYSTPANGPRSDVNNWLGIGGNHGFSGTAPLRPGPNVICVYSIGVDTNAHTLLGCPTVQGNAAARIAAPEAQAAPLAAAAAPGDAARALPTEPAAGPAPSTTSVSPTTPATTPPATTTPATTTPATTTPATSSAPLSSTAVASSAESASDSSPAVSSSAAASPVATPSDVGTTPGSTISTQASGSPIGESLPPAVATGVLNPLSVTGDSASVIGWISTPPGAAVGSKVRLAVNGVGHDVALAVGPGAVPASPGDAVALSFADTVALRPGSNVVCVYEFDRSGEVTTAPIACRTVVLP